jgi:hypothetical protein
VQAFAKSWRRESQSEETGHRTQGLPTLGKPGSPLTDKVCERRGNHAGPVTVQGGQGDVSK